MTIYPQKKAKRTETRRICALMLQKKTEPVITDAIEKVVKKDSNSLMIDHFFFSNLEQPLQVMAGPVQAASKKIKNAVLFLRLDLPSTLIRHANPSR